MLEDSVPRMALYKNMHKDARSQIFSYILLTFDFITANIKITYLMFKPGLDELTKSINHYSYELQRNTD